MTFMVILTMMVNMLAISALAFGAKFTGPSPNKSKVFIWGSAPFFLSILICVLYLLGVR